MLLNDVPSSEFLFSRKNVRRSFSVYHASLIMIILLSSVVLNLKHFRCYSFRRDRPVDTGRPTLASVAPGQIGRRSRRPNVLPITSNGCYTLVEIQNLNGEKLFAAGSSGPREIESRRRNRHKLWSYPENPVVTGRRKFAVHAFDLLTRDPWPEAIDVIYSPQSVPTTLTVRGGGENGEPWMDSNIGLLRRWHALWSCRDRMRAEGSKRVDELNRNSGSGFLRIKMRTTTHLEM